MTDVIHGGGGGGGGGGKGGGGSQQRTPTEDPNSLFSTSYARLVDLISEGEIEGLKDGLKSIYVNNTPLQNPDNSYNFDGVTVVTRNGRQDQSYVPGFDEIANEVSVGTTVVQATPITRTITNTAIDGARVTITVPQLQRITDTGDVVGSVFRFQIAVQRNGGGYTTVVDDTVRGRTGSSYQRDYLLQGLTGGPFPLDIKVTRITNDSSEQDVGGASARITNAFTWTSYSEIIWGRLAYPNSALVAIRVNAEQFSSIPSRSYRIRGIKVRIPDNATVDSATGRLIYSGTWYGAFGPAQWCSDPAWCLYDLLSSRRYGFGRHIDTSQLDKWAFYSASQYASAQVDSGLRDNAGNPILEPRFSCNINIQNAEDAYKLINDMCSVFRAMPYWSAGTITVSQDKPVDTAYLFTYANVGEEGFSYSGSSLKARPNVAVVQYMDLDLRDKAYEVTEDITSIAKYGIIKTELEAFACTSRGQARRIGEWLLYSSTYETEIVTFTASIDAGVIVRPGQVIEISDPVRAGVRRGGRVVSATTTVITVDNADGITATSTPTLSAILSNTSTVETRTVVSVVGNVITVSPAFSSAPNPNSTWIFQNTTVQTSTWRVLSVQEQDQTQYKITALSYNESKYAYIERGTPLEERDTSTLNDIPAAPTNLSLVEALYRYRDQISSKIIISWKNVPGVSQYLVKYRKDSANWTTVRRQQQDYEILDTTPGYFEIAVYSLSAGGQPSNTALTGTITALGKTAPPSNVPALYASLDPDVGVTLNWDPVTDLDLQGYEIWQGAAWNTGTQLGLFSATSKKLGLLPMGTTTWWIKALDTSDIYSTSAVSASVTLTAPAAPTTVAGNFANENYVITWTPTNGSLNTDYYELRFGDTGGSWTTAQPLSTVKGTSFSVNANWTGARRFYVAAVDLIGTVGANAYVDATVIAVPAPTITTTVSGKVAILNWSTVAGNLPTIGYEIRRGTTYATATNLGTIQATTYKTEINWAGAQTFWVTGINSNNALGVSGSAVVVVSAPPAPVISNTFLNDQYRLSWSAVAGTLDTVSYQIRQGDTFSTATVLATVDSTTYSAKVTWVGSQRFWVVGYDTVGNIGTEAFQSIVITAPSAPAISQQVIDNNVLLRWNDVTQTLPIVYYELRKGATWAGATTIGTKQGLFTTVFETVSGTYTYWLAGVDSAGNVGTPANVSAVVNQPPDYILRSNIDSTFTGTRTNVVSNGVGILATVDPTETWQSHFTTRSWSTPQDQINAGYSIYALPSATSGSYVEEFDYGTVLAGTKITTTLTSSVVIGSQAITPTLSVKQAAGDVWTDYAGQDSIYATSFRYVKVAYAFSSTGNDDLLQINGLNVRLDIKIKNDMGNGAAFASTTGATYSQSGTTITVTSNSHGRSSGTYVELDFTSGTATDGNYLITSTTTNTFTVTSATSTTTSGNVNLDTGGTPFYFNVPFVDIESITVTPSGTTARIAIYDFVDTPNPTSFKVLLFDTSGNRVTGGFSWQARGS